MPRRPPLLMAPVIGMTWALVLNTLPAPCAGAQEGPVVREVAGQKIRLLSGQVKLSCEAATIDIPPGLVFLSQHDARFVVELMWRNPLNASIVGMIVPADSDLARDPAGPAPGPVRPLQLDAEAMPVAPPPEPEPGPPSIRDEWATVIVWNEGHVREAAVRGLDYDRILAAMQAAMPRANASHRSSAIPKADLLGWAAPPSYDAARHLLVWAKRLRFYYGEPDAMNRLDVAAQINHCAYLLGARGVLEFTTIGDAHGLAEIQQASQKVLARTSLLPGHRYEDFRPGVDLEYQGDLGARIAGGDDPGNLDLAVKSQHAFWVLACLALAALAGLVLHAVLRRQRLLSLPRAAASPEAGTVCRCCRRDLDPQTARCPACGASNVIRPG